MKKILTQVIIVALLWIIVATPGKLRGDTPRRLLITHSWLTGEPEVTLSANYKSNSRMGNPRLDPSFGVLGVGGKRYYGDDLGQSILMLPGDWLGTQLQKFFPGQDSEQFRHIVVSYAIFVPLNLAVIVVVYLFLRLLGFSEGISGLSSLIFLTCTTFLYYVQSTQQNNQVLLLVTMGYATALMAIKSGRSKWLIASGLSLGFACLIRYTSLIHVLSVSVFLVSCQIYENRNFVSIIKSAAIWIGGFLPFSILARILNYLRFGSWSGSGQSLSIAKTNQDPLFHSVAPFPENYPFINPVYEGIIGVLLTPGKSIFIYDPLLLPCLIVGAIYWKQISPYIRLYLISACFNLALYTVALGKFDFWHGDSAWGARYHVTSVHLILIPLLAIFLEKIVFSRGVKAWLAKILLVLALLIQSISLVFTASTEANNYYFVNLKQFFEFRLAKRVNNIICVTTPFPSLECREKRETNTHRNLYKRLALLPFVYNNPLVLILWISSLILAILASLRFWYIYKP